MVRGFFIVRRAIGKYKKGSDVDIAIKGETITTKTISDLNDYLNEVYPLPYFFGILHYEGINNKKLKEHIDSLGIIFYQKETC